MSAMIRLHASVLWILALFMLVGCKPDLNPKSQQVEEEAFSGGEVTVFDESVNAFSFSAPKLTREELRFFGVGNSFFNQNWVQAPASTTARDGLGPMFNARSCAGCHFKDGRGRSPAFDGEAPTGYLVRLGKPGQLDAQRAPVGHHQYGTQIQTNAILGVETEAAIVVRYDSVSGTFADGTSFTLRKPAISFKDEAFGIIDGVALSARVANQMPGLGLLDAISEDDILALADPEDTDGDGISGKPNYVWNVLEGRHTLGRFGWKAEQPTVRQQVASAFIGDMGITTSLFPDQNCTDSSQACSNTSTGGSPEIEDRNLAHVTLYASTLAVPARRNWDNPIVLAGKLLFEEIGCASCHVPELQTSISPVADALSNQTIRPYTDLLLHDMGPELADGLNSFDANGQEWRTPPLWGLGLIPVVNGHQELLHDGRARNIAEAILWHGGEAEKSKEQFRALERKDRESLLEFLQSL